MENRILKLCKDIVNKEEELTCNGINCKECPFEFTSKELCYACEEHRYNEGMEIAIRYIKEHSPIKEEIKIEKTFREVIADIKEGEVWECRSKYIKRFPDGIQIYHKEKGRTTPSMLMCNNDKFKLQRKEYTFEEAFKAYEEGKEIESCVSGDKYKKEDVFDLRNGYFLESPLKFGINEVRGKWYINN